ncbi:hypothetical protein D6745_03810 [Candidatus Woesearchaeota archaeon]|nr:MAG: hypothetical protein D6745_03810 [Candidatus Woesearchaeota archaeon]
MEEDLIEEPINSEDSGGMAYQIHRGFTERELARRTRRREDGFGRAKRNSAPPFAHRREGKTYKLPSIEDELRFSSPSPNENVLECQDNPEPYIIAMSQHYGVPISDVCKAVNCYGQEITDIVLGMGVSLNEFMELFGRAFIDNGKTYFLSRNAEILLGENVERFNYDKSLLENGNGVRMLAEELGDRVKILENDGLVFVIPKASGYVPSVIPRDEEEAVRLGLLDGPRTPREKEAPPEKRTPIKIRDPVTGRYISIGINDRDSPFGSGHLYEHLASRMDR